MIHTKKRKVYIIFSGIALLTVMITIFCLSAQNGQASSETSGWVVDLLTKLFGSMPDESVIRTLAHFCEFAGLGFVMSNFIFALKDKPKPLLCILLSWGYAWTDEIHQIFVPQRAFQLIDLTVDLGGIVLGTLVYVFLNFLINKRKNKIH